jgi:hypothetical protein
MSNQLLGTVLASPVVVGNSLTDAYGTHYSILGIGGYQEFLTISERNGIPIDSLNRLGDDGLSSGRRRLGMLIYVSETDIVYKLSLQYNIWTGLTTSNKVAALADNNNWLPFTSGSGGDAIKKKYTQVLHGFSVGTVIAYNGLNFVPKIANGFDPNEVLGIISKIDDVNNFTITYAGFIDTTGFGLNANTTYFVSPTIAGALTSIEPLIIGQENRPILITQTTTTGLVVQYRGQLITDNLFTGSTSGSTSGVQNIYSNKKIVTVSTLLLTTDFVVFVNGNTPLTITLPLSPIDGEVLKIKDVSGNASINNVTINGNGKNIDNGSTTIINTDRGGIEICFDSILNYWSIMNFIS